MGADSLLTAYILFWLTVFGAVMGSFLDCAAWRIAHGESLVRGRSHCGSCGHSLGVRDLIPVFSYLFHRGRCRYCGEKIPTECLASEVLGAVGFLGLGWHFGLRAELAMWLILASILLVLALIDWNIQKLPDKLLVLAVVNRLAFLVILGQPAGETLVGMVMGACSVSVPLLLIVLAADRLLGRETMGGGDIKLMFALGLYMDWLAMCLILLVACVLGIALGLFVRKKERNGAIPFGPAIITAWYLVLLFGGPLLTWYRGLLFL